ncbi:MAG TPA: amino acid adenylation domain-containing protein [Pyrinomonadaceae bacterium]
MAFISVAEENLRPTVPACVHSLVEGQARRTPARTAVKIGDQTLTYAELDAAANRVAVELIERGVRPDAIVAISLERSLELVIGLLGILKAGAAYMPIEPDLPDERIALMVEDARPCAGIWAEAHAARFAQLGVAAVSVGRSGGLPACAPRAQPMPASLAYLLYTSGSTGRPKGVAYTHGGAVNRLDWFQATYNLAPEERVLQKTPFGFDVSFWEFFWPLCVGAALVLAAPDGHRDPRYLADLIEREQISVVHFVPSMLQAFLEAADLERKCRSLRWVFASGEALTPRLETRFFARLTAGLHNQYGPTESGECSFWPCAPGQQRAVTPIGYPISGFRFHVLDATLAPTVAGAPGELYIAGEAGLARGYYGQPDLTAERFLPDPSGSAGARMYRTGDLVRAMPEVGLEFLGRADDQVKIRGHRVELGEVESALAEAPGVLDALALARESKAGDLLLVGYLIADAGVSETDIRSRLAAKLPAAMLPTHLIFLSEWPLTRNGKLDRARLPDPEQATGAGELPGASELELAVAELWGAVVGRQPATLDEDFFVAGGDSLRALRLMSRLSALTGLDLTLADFGGARTVRALASALETQFARSEVNHD